MILNICDITHYSITLFKNLLYKDIQLYYKSVYVMIVFQILSSRQISRNQASLKFLSRKWSYITSTKRHIICHIFPVLRCNNFNFSSAMKSHNIIKKRNLLLLCYFLFLKISSELWNVKKENICFNFEKATYQVLPIRSSS